MTDRPERPQEPPLVHCETCLKEIPASAAKNAEAGDYVLHFCGIECYRRWQKQPPASDSTTS